MGIFGEAFFPSNSFEGDFLPLWFSWSPERTTGWAQMDIGLGEDSGWEQGLQEEGCALRRGCVLGEEPGGVS